MNPSPHTIHWAMNVAANAVSAGQPLGTEQAGALAAYVANGGSYPHGFHIPDVSADGYAASLAHHCPAGWALRAMFWGRGTPPEGSFRVGQYKVRTGDRESPIYMCPDALPASSAH